MRIFKQWRDDERGLAAMEAAMIFPILAIMLVGSFDLGYGILASQKTVRASQIVADLVSRDSQIDSSGLDEAVWAGELALEPFDADSFGVDIVSISFDADEEAQIEWRETRNMAPNADVLVSVLPLASANGGVMVITVQYDYEPIFAGFSLGGMSIGQIPMREIAFTRGRKSAVVDRI
ncbi:MAG: TadE/TadG family type IV pilus assembly protein [Alphaproteobacteria bacterium]